MAKPAERTPRRERFEGTLGIEIEHSASLKARLEAAEARLREVEEAGRAYVATTDPLVACGPVDDPAGDKCGDCRACALARAEAVEAQVRELEEERDTQIRYKKQIQASLDLADAATKNWADRAEVLSGEVRELRAALERMCYLVSGTSAEDESPFIEARALLARTEPSKGRK